MLLMTDEKGTTTGVIDTVIDGVSVYFDGSGVQIDDIPSDGQEQTAFNMASHGNSDLFIGLVDLTGESYIPKLRFNSGFGGPNIELIFEELVLIRDSFRSHRGQLMVIPPLRAGIDRIPGHLPLRVQKGKDTDPFQLKITDITDDKGDDEMMRSQMDLELARAGDVTLTVTGDDEQLFLKPPLSIVFKTAENGGRFPVMAQAFGRIATRLARARRG